jgi:hypothetical protein
MLHRFSHLAITVEPDQIKGSEREELLKFYGALLGWVENRSLSIPGKRIFLRAPSDTQYITIRSAEKPMQTSGYEQLGVLMESEEELCNLYARAKQMALEFQGVGLGEITSEYGGSLLSFRLSFRLPITFEFQYVR